EPVLDRSSFRLTPQRPSVPAGIRHPFLLASLAVIASWSLGGLFFSLGPGLSAQLFRSSSVLVAGIGAVALALAGALSQMIFHRTAPWTGAAAGSAALAAGTMLIVAAAVTGSGAAYLAGSVRRRSGLRRRVPRRPPPARGRDPGAAPRRRDVGLLRRRVRLAVAARRPRRPRRDPPRAARDVRDLRQHRRGRRAGHGHRGLAHPTRPPERTARIRTAIGSRRQPVEAEGSCVDREHLHAAEAGLLGVTPQRAGAHHGPRGRGAGITHGPGQA